MRRIAYFGKPLIFLAAALLCVTVAAQEPSRKDIRKSNELVSDGNKAFNQKNYRDAIDKYAEAVVMVPRNATAHFWKGYAHYYLKEYPMALAELNMAEEQGHAAVDVSKVRWFIHYEGKNFDAALADVKRGLQAEPNNQMMLRAAGDIYFEKKNYPDSLAAYRQALLAAPNDGTLYYAIARVLQASGDVKGQEEAAAIAVSKPNQFLLESNYILADAQHRQRKFEQALATYNKLLAAHPDNIQIYRSMGDVFRGQSKFSDAIDITRQAINKWPQDGNLYTDISWYYSLNGQHKEAVETAQSAVRLLPEQYMGFTNLCRAHNDLKQYQFALTACNNALRLNPDDGETYFYLGRAYRELGKTAEANRAFDRSVPGLVTFTQNNPDYSDGFYLLGNAYSENGNFEKALEAYRKCLQLSPKFSRAWYNSGAIYVHLNKKNEAMTQYQALASLDADLASKLKQAIDQM
ncbi:MAG TPA: tetratricopeptide repeat protein [Pyrinomonadaceae bacterium]